MKTKLPLPEAQKFAARITDALAPHCQRIRCAGSIRRQSPLVGDIEIVCQPKTGTDLFGQPYPLPIPTEGLGRHEVSGERYRKIILPEGVQLDLFIVLPPAQWGVIFAIRTGGAEFSRRLVTSRLHGGFLPPQYVVKDGAVHSAVTNEIVPTPEESDFFRPLRAGLYPTTRKELNIMFELQFIGNLGKDPEARYTQDGVLVVNFPVAVTVKKDETVWVEVTAWRELAQRCHQYLAKGRQVFVRGIPTVEAFTRKNGEAGAALKVTAQMVQFVGGKGKETDTAPATPEEDEIPF